MTKQGRNIAPFKTFNTMLLRKIISVFVCLKVIFSLADAHVSSVQDKEVEKKKNMQFNLEGKIFASIDNSGNSEIGEETIFLYHQDGNIAWAEYEGGSILKGHLIANILNDSKLDMRYHHITVRGELCFGKCISTPEILPDGRLKFKEQWQLLSGDNLSGYSEIIEVDSL